MSDLRPFPPMRKRPMKLNTLVTLMVCAIIGSVLLVVFALYSVQITRATRDDVKDTALGIARTLADSPDIKRGLMASPQAGIIQPIAQAVTKRNDLLFTVVTDLRGVRYSHPNEALLGLHFIGDDLTPALEGKENVSVNRGALAEALRVFTPVYDDRHDQIGVVVVGISLNKVEDQIARGRLNAVWTILFSVLMSSLAIWGLVRVLKRILFGLEPYEISALFEQRQAMLQSLREGVMAVDMHGRVTMINHTAREILLLTSGQHSESSSEPLLASLREVSKTGIARQDQEIGCNGRLLLCNMVPVKSQNQVIGAISTFRDKTEISQLMQRIDGMVNYVDALRSHTHEFMNKLHVILGLLHMKRYDKLEEYIIQTAQNYQTDIGAIQRKVKSPVIAGFLLGKINRAKEAGVTLTLAEESQLPDTTNEEQVAVLITVLGNLIENALDAMEGQPEGEIGLLLHYQNGWLSGEVSDDGPGIDPERLEAIFTKGYSTKGENRGVGLFLARQQIQNLGGDITVESEPGVFTQFFVQIPWDSERNIA
ncbi:two-component system sensor histidine kinase DcuS [Enterobacter quasihormaechei]|uniref:Sensor histidine kinase DcuS n=1 Tax=Enterobacter quasihormaechei TaxID=2529382 RepID=A0AAE8QWY5_9ENTR|nr:MULTISPECIES: sensor histidine kinase [Enterobacter]MBM7015781.1 two-component system sensor histidine kinase DcuS [Enterobacter cloacae]RAY66257.1 two-component system sensor histidine kinase DcuS [Enterobacter hormaechei]MBE3469362.1 two-component system sensor histidine kinase DcuS [Enterobacter cloacae complex sp. P15RS]MBE4966591.1 two-component system sensor histidine kinase DcuS [Enterobacter cloacae complex sp. P24RS]MDH1125198.1 sensor histidine kinase [Enterobacter sp. GD03975]